MNPFASPLDKARGAADAADRRLADFEAKYEAKLAELASAVDFEANLALREEVAVLARKRDAARDARDHARQALAQAEAAHEKAEADSRHAAAQKLAAAHAKLTLDIVALFEKAAPMLAKAEEMRADIEQANKVRGQRPLIADGEWKVRHVPSREIPADTSEEWVWQDSAGNQPAVLIDNGEGGLRPFGASPHGHGTYVHTKVQVVNSPARLEPPHMPARLAEAVSLVGLKGEALWPRK